MRKLLVSKLDFNQRKWFFKAALKMIIVDKTIAPEEVEDLKDSLQHCAGKDVMDLKDIFRSPSFAKPLTELKSVPYENAFIILMEVARVAAIDSKFVKEEEEFLKEIFLLLGFKEEGMETMLSWVRRLATVNQEEAELKKRLTVYFENE